MLRILEILALIVVLYVLISQIIVPLIRDRKTFPVLRRGRRELETQLTEVREEADEANLEQTLNKETGRVKRLRGDKTK